MNWLEQIFGGASDLFASLQPAATAQALAVALAPIAGGKPAVVNYGDYAVLEFTPEQEDRISAWIITQLKREPGPVRVESGGIALKVLTRQYWPWAVGLALAGAAFGYAAGRR